MKSKLLFFVITASLVFCFGLCGCGQQETKSEEQNNQDQASSQQVNADEETSQQSEEIKQEEPLSKKIIGVWSEGENSVAFDGKNFLYTGNNLYTSYKVNDEEESISFGQGSDIDIKSVTDHSLSLTGLISETFSKTDNNPSKFIKKNYIVLTPSKSWKNKSVRLSVRSFNYQNAGDDINHGDGTFFKVVTPGYFANLKISNLIDENIYPEITYTVVKNGKIEIVDDDISLGFNGISPYDDKIVDESYSLPPRGRKSIKSVKMNIRFRTIEGVSNGEEENHYITPWLTIAQK